MKRSGGLKAERVFLPNRKDPIALPPSSRALLLLQRVRDESHRFAIEFQRELRSKQNFASILEELPGIGPGKRRALLARARLAARGARGADRGARAACPASRAATRRRSRRFFAAMTRAYV